MIGLLRMMLVNALIPKRVMKEVEEQIDILYPPRDYELGICHRIWSSEKALLAARGYKWYSPSDMYPNIRFD